MDLKDIGRKVVEASQACADGYRRNISQFNTAAENDTEEKCSIAASNTGWFILQALGLTNEEKRELVDEYHANQQSGKTT